MPDDLFRIVLEELRAFREENRKTHEVIFNRINDQNARIRQLEVWRGYLIGLASAVATGISLAVSWAFRRG